MERDRESNDIYRAKKAYTHRVEALKMTQAMDSDYWQRER